MQMSRAYRDFETIVDLHSELSTCFSPAASRPQKPLVILNLVHPPLPTPLVKTIIMMRSQSDSPMRHGRNDRHSSSYWLRTFTGP